MGAAALLIGSILVANAEETVVKTLNSGSDGMIVFDPADVKIQPGDTIRFVPAEKGYTAELIKGTAPEGAPHSILGMVGLIQVGDKPENLEAANAVQHGKLATKRFEPLFEKVE